MKTLKKLFQLFRKNNNKKELTREQLEVKAARGSAYAIRNYHETLDRLAEYDRAK